MIESSFRNGVLLVTLLVIGTAPFVLGSNVDWAWAPLAALVGLGLVILSLESLWSKDFGGLGSSLAWPAIAMTCVLAWATFQALPLSAWINGRPIFSELADSLLHRTGYPIALDPELAITGVMRLLAYCGIFLLAARVSDNRAGARKLCWVMIGSAVLVTLYGFALEFSGQTCFALFVKKRLEAGAPCTFSGSFINSANYATFAGIAGLVCIAQIQSAFGHAESQAGHVRERWRKLIGAATGKGGILIAILVFLLAGLVFSESRAGLLSFLAAAILQVMVVNAFRHGRWSSIVWPTLAVVAIVALAVSITGEGVLVRLADLAINGDPDRGHLRAITIHAISLRPWTGWGLGSFESLYTVLQPIELQLLYQKVHNVFLENALDLGIPVSLLLLSAVIVIVVRCVKGAYSRSRDIQLPLLGLSGSVLVGIHSLVSFDLQIPAVAFAYASLLGLAWKQSWSSRSRGAQG